jgi:nicotinic acid mononucleotide adenylyltransferase/nicotinamide mononucleotide (NMN) deamidase PncC
MNADLLAKLHASPKQGVIVLAGGGASALAQLLGASGASNTLLEASVPYSASALEDFLGRAPLSSVSSETARSMAAVAFQRANALDPDAAERNFGLSITAALTTNRARRGADRAYIALHCQQASYLRSIEFTKSEQKPETDAPSGTRDQQEAVLCHEILGLLSQHMDIEWPDAKFSVVHESRTDWVPAPLDWQQVMVKARDSNQSGSAGNCLFPGAFNPVHQGHLLMKTIAEQLTGLTVNFELSIHNVDKPCLDYFSIKDRTQQLRAHGNTVLTNAPTFIEKARIFPNTTFVIGIDTLLRIDQVQYYGSDSLRDAALAELTALGIQFLVFGRLNEGAFLNLDRVEISDSLAARCKMVPETVFRQDISSTTLRTSAAQATDATGPGHL